MAPPEQSVGSFTTVKDSSRGSATSEGGDGSGPDPGGRRGTERRILSTAHDVEVVDEGVEAQSGVEDVDVTVVAQPLFLEQGDRGLGIGMGPSDDGLGLGRQQIGIDRIGREELGDVAELVAPPEIGFAELALEEPASDGVPERGTPIGFGESAHLGHHAIAEAFPMRRHEDETGQRQQAAPPTASGVGMQEQGADHRRSRVVVDQVQDPGVDPHPEIGRGL